MNIFWNHTMFKNMQWKWTRVSSSPQQFSCWISLESSKKLSDFLCLKLHSGMFLMLQLDFTVVICLIWESFT